MKIQTSGQIYINFSDQKKQMTTKLHKFYVHKVWPVSIREEADDQQDLQEKLKLVTFLNKILLSSLKNSLVICFVWLEDGIFSIYPLPVLIFNFSVHVFKFAFS